MNSVVHQPTEHLQRSGLGTTPIVWVVAGLMTRIIVVILDSDGSLTQNTDAASFHRQAIRLLDSGGSIYGSAAKGGSNAYVAVVAGLYRLFGVHPIVPQLVNVALSLAAILLVLATIKRLDRTGPDQRAMRQATLGVVIYWAITPPLLLFTVLGVRESFVSFFIALAVRMGFSEKDGVVALSFVPLLAAGVLHSGTIVLLAIPVLVLFIARERRGRGSAMAVLTAFGAIAAAPLWLPKILRAFGVGEVRQLSAEELLLTSLEARGGSAYSVPFEGLPGLLGLLGLPFRAVYFLASPLPWTFRGLADVLAFVSGALILGVLLIALRRRRHLTRLQRAALLIPLLIFTITFSASANNAGTDARHRLKGWPIVAVLAVAVANPAVEPDSIRKSGRGSDAAISTVRTPDIDA